MDNWAAHGQRRSTAPGPSYISPLVFPLIMEAGYPDELIELRLMFEPAFSVMAMERATVEDRERNRMAVERIEHSVRSRAPAAGDEIAFHLAILKATQSPHLIRIGATTFQLLEPSIGVSMRHIAARAVQDHRQIFDACHSGDAAQLRTAVVESYDGWKESLCRPGVAVTAGSKGQT